MILLDRVLEWNGPVVTCETEAHLRLDNPLRRDNVLTIVTGVEIAAQAMAIHGCLAAGDDTPRQGRLGSLREVWLGVSRLDTVPGPIIVTVQRLSGGGEASIYTFRLTAAARLLLSGRAGVFFT